MKKIIKKVEIKHIKYWISLLLVIVWMVALFMLSAEVSSDSADTSNRIVDVIIKLSYKSNIVSQEKYDNISFIVRKLAHFSLYAVGGILIANYMRLNKLKKYLIYSIILGIIYSITDEIHQLFVPR